MPNPLVTIIIPSYNHAAYIQKTVESVVRQTYKPIELIVIDDGSTDGSQTLLAGLAAEYGFCFESQANQGLSRTLNKGIALAQGKYICTVGSDDILLLDKTERQVAFMESNPTVAVCGGNQLIIDSDGIIVNKRQRFEPYREFSFDDLFLGRKALIAASSAMFRADVLAEQGGYDPDIPLEDMYMWLKLSSRGCRIVGLNDVLIYYRKHASNSYKNAKYMMDSMEKTYAAYARHPQYSRVINDYRRSMFLRAAKYDRQAAVAILRKLPLRFFNLKVMRGLFYCLRG
ncbi:MAG: glycosyltransferase [Spongiibacteraceae bacterium]